MTLGVSIGVGAGKVPSAPTIQPLSAYWEPETTTFDTATGSILTAAEKFAIDRFYKYLKSSTLLPGFWARISALPNAGIWLLCQGTEAKSLINLLHPGTKDLTKNGSPTFAAFDGVTALTSSDFYDTGIAVNALSQNSASLGVVTVTNNAGVSNGYEIGVIDAGGTARFTLMVRNGTSTMTGACMNATVASVGSSSDYLGASFRAFSRTGSANHGVFSPGIRQSTQTAASIAPVGTTTITILKANGLSVASPQKVALAFVLDGLSDTEMAYFHAACRILVDGFRRGLPKIQPAGYGDETVTKDLIIFGNSLAAFVAAWEADRQGLSVAIVTDHYTESAEQLGGMPANGLGRADVGTTVTPAACGLFREMTIEINARNGSADSNNQNGLSEEARSWNTQVRKMFDPTWNSGLIGRDITIYLSTGLKELTKDGNNKILTLTDNAGRVFVGSFYADQSYDGDLIYLSGCPYTTGREADGTGDEALAGFHLSQASKPGDAATSNKYNIDPYVTPATPASGLLYGISAAPGYSDGQAYPGLQQNNFRLMAANVKSRRAPFVGGPSFSAPPGYNASNYEVFARYCAACTAAGHTVTADDVFNFGAVGSSGSAFDLNNSSGISSDFGGSGYSYAAAGFDIAARNSVRDYVMSWMRGLIYYIATTSDSRVTAHTGLQTAFLTTNGLEGSNFLDMVSWRPLYWPGLMYRREPIWQLNNAANGGFRYTGNDLSAANGATPRSGKTVSVIDYISVDHHAEVTIAYDSGDGAGTVLYRQGAYSDPNGMGANGKTPVPIEVMMPNEADCPNLFTTTCPSLTKRANSAYRMEKPQCVAAQMMAITTKYAKANAISLQNAGANHYSDIRTDGLALPESVALDLPTLA